MTQKTPQIRTEIGCDPARGRAVSSVVGPRSNNFAVFINRCPGMRSLPIESHILFYRVTANRLEIIRVLHGRQDPVRDLKSTYTTRHACGVRASPELAVRSAYGIIRCAGLRQARSRPAGVTTREATPL
jgi:hypothetical protein